MRSNSNPLDILTKKVFTALKLAYFFKFFLQSRAYDFKSNFEKHLLFINLLLQTIYFHVNEKIQSMIMIV